MLWLIIFKEICLLLQIPIDLSYAIAGFLKHAFMINLSMLIMAMYIKSISGFWIYKKFILLWLILHKIQILCFGEKKFNSLSG